MTSAIRQIQIECIVTAGKYESTPRLLELVRHAESDAWLSLGLAFYLNVLPLSRQLSCLSGALWSRVLQVTHLLCFICWCCACLASKLLPLSYGSLQRGSKSFTEVIRAIC